MTAIAADRLKRDVERIKKHRLERKEIGASERDIFTALKVDGYNPKALRRLLALDSLTDREQVESDMDDYRVALGMTLVGEGLSLRQAAEESGASKSSIHRALAVPACPTVEMTADDLRGDVEAALRAEGIGHNSKRACTLPATSAWQEITAARTEHEARIAAEKEAARAKRRAEQSALAARNAEIDADDLAFPAHLDRRQVEA